MEGKSRIMNLKEFKDKFFGKKGTMILLLIGFAGILLIALSEMIPAASSSSKNNSSSSSTTADYEKSIQSQLCGIIGKIDGVGRVNVMVTVESGVQYVYEQTEKTSNDKNVNSQSDGSTQTQENADSEDSPVIVDNGNDGQKALVKTEIQPTIKGVVVVCDGGENPVVQERIVSTVTTALGIQADCVTVCKMAAKS